MKLQAVATCVLFLLLAVGILLYYLLSVLPVSTTHNAFNTEMLIVKTRQRWVAITLWATFGFGVTAWLVIRRAGFSSSYIRCHYNIMHGDYKQFLQAGTTPANVFLPPHLRLDQRSYLDHPETELAVPPMIDVGLQEAKHIRSLEGSVPKSERTDIHGHVGPFRTHSIMMTPTSGERYIKRRLGPSDADAEALVSEHSDKTSA